MPSTKDMAVHVVPAAQKLSDKAGRLRLADDRLERARTRQRVIHQTIQAFREITKNQRPAMSTDIVLENSASDPAKITPNSSESAPKGTPTTPPHPRPLLQVGLMSSKYAPQETTESNTPSHPPVRSRSLTPTRPSVSPPEAVVPAVAKTSATQPSVSDTQPSALPTTSDTASGSAISKTSMPVPKPSQETKEVNNGTKKRIRLAKAPVIKLIN